MATTDERKDTAAGGVVLDREILLLGAVVVLGTIMTVLDLTIVNVAVPTLGRDFGTSIATIQWVLTGYTLAFASVIPLTGWASERFGAKRVFVFSLVLFLLGSVLAGSAWSIGSLIGFRVLQGLGAGMILPVGQTILAQAAGPQRIGRVMSVIFVPGFLAPIFGPLIGGAIVDATTWRWIFFLNLPIGVIAITAATRLLPDTRPQLGQRLDLRGLALLSPGIAVFLYGVSEAGNQGGFSNTHTLAAVAGGLALVASFVWHASRRREAALIDLTLFRRRGFATAAAANFLLIGALMGSLILLPLYYQLVRHQSPIRVGLLLAPQGLGAAMAMPVAGWLTDNVGARLVVPAGLAAAVLGTLAYTQVGANTSYLYLAAALLVLGLGIGSTILPSMAAAFQTLSHHETPKATSALNTIQRIAGAIGTALFAIILQRTIAAKLPHLHGGIQALAALTEKQHARAAPALSAAFGTSFWVALGLIAAALLPALLLPRPAREPGAAAAESATQSRAAA
jgi:EmrB/QacA subfamily drug resistance transporter